MFTRGPLGAQEPVTFPVRTHIHIFLKIILENFAPAGFAAIRGHLLGASGAVFGWLSIPVKINPRLAARRLARHTLNRLEADVAFFGGVAIVILVLRKEVMNHLANSKTIKPEMRMLFILCGATGLRLGEALGIRIEKILDSGSRIIIDEKAWRGEIHDYLKTDNGERGVDLPENVAKLLVEFIGNRTAGLLFKTRHGKQWSQSNILRRHLHPALEEIGFEKAGAHSFRRYRNTFLRNHTNCPESILNFWLGWGAEGMSGLYDKVKADVAFRKEVANRCGVGFNVPATLSLIEPKLESLEVAINP